MPTNPRPLLVALILAAGLSQPASGDVATITANGLYSSCAAFIDGANKGPPGADIMTGPGGDCWAVVAVEGGARALAANPGFCSPRALGEGYGAWLIYAGAYISYFNNADSRFKRRPDGANALHDAMIATWPCPSADVR